MNNKRFDHSLKTEVREKIGGWVIIFLDFDGVLHPFPTRGADNLFSSLPVLWKLLDTLPEASVVITSSWREQNDLRTLTDLITANGGEHYRDRIIGVTPVAVSPDVILQGERQDEIEAWISANTFGSVRYVILDDIPDFFHPGCTQLYLANYETGLVDDDVPKIVEMIRDAE